MWIYFDEKLFLDIFIGVFIACKYSRSIHFTSLK